MSRSPCSAPERSTALLANHGLQWEAPLCRKEDLKAITKVSIDLVKNGSPPLLLIGPDVVTPLTHSPLYSIADDGSSSPWLLGRLTLLQAYKTRALMSEITSQEGSLAYHSECIRLFKPTEHCPPVPRCGTCFRSASAS